ncbi:hypothetical protein BX666DRAFT_2109627 [Dichotomocladium elegans]|nr:hypothetical protein BX666DRAFT_2109627 [Dichotomocladium elegans]
MDPRETGFAFLPVSLSSTLFICETMENIQNFGRRIAQRLVSWCSPLNQIDTSAYGEIATTIRKAPTKILESLHKELKAAASRLQNTMQRLSQKQLELFAELYEAKRRSRELEDEISVAKRQHHRDNKGPKVNLTMGNNCTRVEERFLIEEAQGEERLEVEEENVMATETEFGQDFVMDLDAQQQAEIIQQLVKEKHELKSALLEYQRKYPTSESLGYETRQIDRAFRKVKQIRNDNDQLKEENQLLRDDAFYWKLCVQSENIEGPYNPSQIIYRFSRGREARHAAKQRVNELAAEIEMKEASERNLVRMIDDLRNETAALLEAKHSPEIKYETLVQDKRMFQLDRDLLDHQLKYPLAKRIEEPEGHIKNIQQEAENARQEAVAAKLSWIEKQVVEFRECRASPEPYTQPERLLRLSTRLIIGKRRRDEGNGNDADDVEENTACAPRHAKNRRVRIIE